MNHELLHPAPTMDLIADVDAAEKLRRIPAGEASMLRRLLRDGAIIAPIWEDYGLRTLPNGRAALP